MYPPVGALVGIFGITEKRLESHAGRVGLEA